jgi:hypothetical protein
MKITTREWSEPARNRRARIRFFGVRISASVGGIPGAEVPREMELGFCLARMLDAWVKGEACAL